MEMRSSISAFVGAADLARVQPFNVGPMRVDPPTRTISYGTSQAILEPRVMQALVALGQEPGQVLSRDDLIALAWDGRIVGDNAINRVISLLRQALLEVAGDTVKLETITKVGFRIISSDADLSSKERNSARPRHLKASRRTLIVAATTLLGAGVLGSWLSIRKPSLDPRAVELTRQADLLMKSGLPGSTRQATRNLEAAVRIAPDYADGWGYLALMYRHAMNGFAGGERRNLVAMMNSAANRALVLDPAQSDAQLALALDRPFYRNWSESEDKLRLIVREHPGHWYANAQLALLLMDVGRTAEALGFRQRVIEIDPKIPVAWSLLALNLLQANRLHEADMALEQAFASWPNHPALWLTRYRVLLETARPVEAAQFVRATESRPEGVPDELIADFAAQADGIADGREQPRTLAVSRLRRNMAAPESAEIAAPMFAMLGNPKLALEVTSAYLLGGTIDGRSWPKPDDTAARSSALLFYPSLVQLAETAGYRAILERSGLNDYWKRSGSQPDIRRS